METDQNRQKQGPCGVNGDGRTTNPALITSYRPGETITVRWTETIPHAGHFRIAFLQDGQSFPVPTGIQMPAVAPVLLDGIPDPSGSKSDFSAEVTLPNVECDNCTLQLMQVMKTSPPYSPSDFYFQCADLVLSNGAMGSAGAGGSAGSGMGGSAVAGGGAAPTGGTSGSSSSGSAGMPSSAGGALSAAGVGGMGAPVSGGTAGAAQAPLAGSSGAAVGGAGAVGMSAGSAGVAGATTPSAGTTGASGASAAPSEEEAGCACRTPAGTRSGLPLFGIAGLVWALLRRRRRR